MKLIAFITTALTVYFFWAAKKQRDVSGQVRTGNALGFAVCLTIAIVSWLIVALL